MAQAVGFADPHPVNHVSSLLGDYMKKWIAPACLRAVLAHLQFKCGVHVNRHCFDPRTAFRPQLFKEGADSSSATSFANPQDPAGIGIQHDASVAMPFEQSEFIHYQASELGLRNG